MNLNDITLIGRLADNPQLKQYTRKDGSAGDRCYFPLAVTRNMDRGKPRDEQRTSFIPITCWGEPGKRHAQFLAKGTEVAVRGELIIERVRQNDGSFKQFVSVNAADVQYGQRSLKNASPEQLQTRIDSLQGVMERTKALAAAAGAAAPVSEPAPVGTEFEAPAES